MGGGTTSGEGEIYSSIRGDVMNLLLLELIQKQNEQIQRQSEQLQKMMEARERAPLEDNSHIFKKLANLHPPTYDGAQTLRLSRIGFRGWKNGLMHYNALKSGG